MKASGGEWKMGGTGTGQEDSLVTAMLEKEFGIKMTYVPFKGGGDVAKNLVAAGVADRVEIQVSYAIGVAEPTSVTVETFGTEHVPVKTIEQIVRQEFDLRPYSIIRMLDLIRPIYLPLAAYGHMGREDLGVKWEDTDRVEQIRSAAGL